MTLTVTRGRGLDGQIRVTFTTSESTASRYSDFMPAAGTLVFLPGVDSQTITVSLVSDDTPEGPEEFMVNLTSVELVNDR